MESEPNTSTTEGKSPAKKRSDPKKDRSKAKRIQKRKAQKSQKKLVEKAEVKPAPVEKKVVPTYSSKDSSSRSYSDELFDYLNSWEKRAVPGHQWKFSKVIQSWGLENCFQKDKIDVDLFKKLLPYIVTVQGVARERLLASASEIIEKCESGSEAIGDDEMEEPAVENEDGSSQVDKPKLTKKMLKRAKKVRSILSPKEE